MPTKVFDAFTRLDASDVNAYLANKSISNAIINGAFEINQRGFVSTTTTGTYGFDRWLLSNSGGTTTYSAQSFTPGAAPVSGYESRNFARLVTSGQTLSSSFSILSQFVEDVTTFAGQTITISFWAKAGSETPKISLEMIQGFGTGGSPSSSVNTFAGQVTISTSWTRYSLTVDVPSISGKTLGTTANTSSLRLLFFVSAGSDLNSRTGSLGIQSNTFDFWGVQVEPGTVANDFRRNANSIQGELAACQRYFVKHGGSINWGLTPGYAQSTTSIRVTIPTPVTMRAEPTITDSTPTVRTGSSSLGPSATTVNAVVSTGVQVAYTVAGATANAPAVVAHGSDLALSAEL
jgi:hypothetical protein